MELPSMASGPTARGLAAVIGLFWRRMPRNRRPWNSACWNPPAAAPQAILSDDLGPTSIVASIDLCELANSLDQSKPGIAIDDRGVPRAMRRARCRLRPVRLASRSSKGSPQLSVLSLFKSAGEILLAHESLEEMLQQVVNLIAAHLPGRRGVVWMRDQASGEIQPLCFSQETPREAAAHAQSESHASFPRSDRVLSAEPPPLAQHWRPFVISRSILHEAVRVQRAMLVGSVADDPRFHAVASIHQMGIQSAICVPLYHQGQVRGVIYVDSQHDAGPLSSRDLEVLTVLGLMVAAGLAQIALRNNVVRERTMRDRLARYNSPQVVEQIMKLTPRQEGEMLTEEYDVSVLFADISGFSALAENWEAAETVRVLNLVFERLDGQCFSARRYTGQVYRRRRDGGLWCAVAAGRPCPAGWPPPWPCSVRWKI